MDIVEFKRNVSLYRLGISDLVGKEMLVYSFLVKWLSPTLKVYTSVEFPQTILYGVHKNIILLRYDMKSNAIYIYDIEIYQFLTDSMNFVYYKVPELIIWWVEITLNIKVSKLLWKLGISYDEFEISSFV